MWDDYRFEKGVCLCTYLHNMYVYPLFLWFIKECEKMLKCALATSQTIGDLIMQLDSGAPHLSRTITQLVKALEK